MIKRIGTTVVAVVCAVFGVALAAQQSATSGVGAGLLMGRVVDAASQRPLPNIAVTLNAVVSGVGSSTRRVMTDDQRRYVFRQLLPAGYIVRAEVHGNGYSPNGFLVTGFGWPIGDYIPGGYGQRGPSGPLRPIELADGQRLDDLTIALYRTAAISGTVRDESGEPLVDAVVGAIRVASNGDLIDGPTGKTDDRGRYRFGSLTPGRYVVVVPQTAVLQPSSFVERLLNEPNPGTLMTAVGKTGAIATGAASGVPVAGQVALAGRLAFVTNASAPRAEGFAYPTTFAPSATSVETAAITELKSGESRDAVDVQVMPVRTGVVTGRLMDMGEPAGAFAVHLLPRSATGGESLLEVASALTDSSGRFVMPAVPVGSYTLVAVRLPGSAPRLPVGAQPLPTHSVEHHGRPGAWVEQPVSVEANATSTVDLALQRGASVRGRLEFVGGAMPDARELRAMSMVATFVRPVLRYQGSRVTSAYADDRGGVALAEMVPGRYVFDVSGVPGGWAVRSITAGGLEIGGQAIDIATDRSDLVVTLTPQPIAFSGTVHDDKGAPDPDAVVVMFPADRTRWADARATPQAVRLMTPSAAGNFLVRPAFPGDYLIAAVKASDVADWPDAVVMARLAAVATSVRVDSNGAPAVSLTTKVLR